MLQPPKARTTEADPPPPCPPPPVHQLDQLSSLAQTATVAPKELPYSSLPLCFHLLKPISGSSSPSACLSVHLPIRPTSSAPSDGQDASQSGPVQVQDLREGAEEPAVEVYRTLDPENREPFVSLSRLFLACSVTPIEGLLRFRLDSLGEYDLTLGGLAPFLDLWTPLHLARKIAFSLNRHEELAALLEWETRAAWSVEDKEEGGVVHNWKIGSDRIDPQEYSTALMLSTSFPRIHLLPPSSQIRTLLPPASSAFSSSSTPTSIHDLKKEHYLILWSKLTEWAVREYEAWVEAGAEDAFPAEGARSPPPSSRALSPLASPPLVPTRGKGRVDSGEEQEQIDLAPFFTFTTLSSLLQLLDLLPSSSPSPGPHFPPISLSHLPSLPPLARSAFLSSTGAASTTTPPPPPSLLLQKLYLTDALSRLALHSFREAQVEAVSLRRSERQDVKKAQNERTQQEREEEEAWREGLEKRLRRLEEALSRSSSEERDERDKGPGGGGAEEETEVERLRRDFSSLKEVVAGLSSHSPPLPPATGAVYAASSSNAAAARGGGGGLVARGGGGGEEGRLAFLVLAVFVLGLAVGVGVVKVQ